MARKKNKHPEHENLERWLVSYADFITLLFATFVVLYALSQIDLTEFVKLEDSMKKAFNAPNLIEGSASIMPDSGESILDTSSADSFLAPLMLEYISPKYEEQSFESISESIKNMTKSGELEGVDAKITDKGLLITFKDNLLFYSGSATLTAPATRSLDKVGVLISEKFALHVMRIEGHTDSTPISSSLFPSNWELSSARSSSIIRYMVERFKFLPGLFTAIGYADTRPIADNKTEQGRNMNRRVEILILKNKFKSYENPTADSIMKKSKQVQEQFQQQRMESIKKVRNLSDAAGNLSGDDVKRKNEVIILDEPVKSKSEFINSSKNKEKSLSIKNKTLYEQSNEVQDDNWLKAPASADFEKELNKHFDAIGQ